MIEVRDINIKNEEFLEILNEYKDVLMKKDKGDNTPLIAKEMPLDIKIKILKTGFQMIT